MRDGQGLAVTVADDMAVSAYNSAVTEWLIIKSRLCAPSNKPLKLILIFVWHIVSGLFVCDV